MRNLLFLTMLITINLLASDFINKPLSEFIPVVSRINNINIVLDENIDHKITFLVSKDLKKETYFEVLETLLNNKDMYLEKHTNFYMVKKKIDNTKYKNDTNNSMVVLELQKLNNKIDKIDNNTSDTSNPIEIEERKYSSIKLKFIDFQDIKEFLKLYEETIKYQFIKSSNLLLIKSNEDDFNSIKQFINIIDVLPKQLKLKVTIVDTNLNKLKEFGFENQAQIGADNDSNFFFNLLAYPFTVSSDIQDTKKSQFYTFIKMMNNKGNSKLVSSPILTLSDNKVVDFEVSTNIPYSEGSTTIDDDNTKTTTAIKYKDVGLRLNVTPRINSDKLVYMDLDLEVSNIISNTNNTPIVSIKRIKQSFYIDTNKIFALTGINQTETIENKSAVPYLSDIPFLGWLFKYESTTNTSSNLSIFFEIVNNSNDEKKTPVKSTIKLLETKNKEDVNQRLHNQRLKEILNL